MKALLFIFVLLAIVFDTSLAQEKKGKTIFKYKQYEKFDFDDLVVDAGSGGPGDLSIAPRFQQKFENKLPYRKNFNPEIRRTISRVK